MRQYTRYELQTRKWSANAVIGIYEYTDENGKTKEKSDIILVPTLNKADGDIFAEIVLNHFNEPIDPAILYTGKKRFKQTIIFKE